MNGRGGGTIEEKLPSWECELWSYISAGDGSKCPMYGHCEITRRGGWCPSDHQKQVYELVDGSRHCLRDYDFFGHLTTGRVDELIEQLAKKYIEKGNISRPPVPRTLVRLFDSEHRIQVREVPFKTINGAVWRTKDEWIIYVDSNSTPAEKRFTLFHEAFHILAHCMSTPVFRSSVTDAGSFNELLAQFFAGAILMPREWIEKSWVEFRDLDAMAKIFCAPPLAIWQRLKIMRLV